MIFLEIKMTAKNFSAFSLCWLVFLANSAWADHSSVSLNLGTASPISTESAATLPAGTWAVGVRSEFQQLDRFNDAKLARLREAEPEEDFHSVDSLWTHTVGVATGVTDDFTVGISVPFINRNDIVEAEHDVIPAEIVNLGDVEGIGDIKVIGQYRFFQDAGTHVAAIFGFKAPTGKTSRNADNGERFDSEFQPGSGSWDGLFGGAFTQEMDAFTFDFSVLYTLVTEGDQDTDLGDIFTYNAAVSTRVIGSQAPFGQSTILPNLTLDLVAEVNGEWREKEDEDGEFDPNSGGNIVYLSPGLKLGLSSNSSIGFSFGIPVVKDTNGQQVEPDYRLITTGSISWD